MKRIIKFRVWAAGQIWRLHSLDFGNNDSLGARVNVSRNGSLGFPLEAVSLEQFTGFTDKKGKEIYEGDIVQAGDYRLEIEFDEGQFGAAILVEQGNFYSLYHLSTFKVFEVIGNIHENSELLKCQHEIPKSGVPQCEDGHWFGSKQHPIK